MSVVNWLHSSYDIYIGRHVPNGPTDVLAEECIYGNPFVLIDVNDVEERAKVIAAYESWLLSPEQNWLVEMARVKLSGKVLGCWCKPKDCHGDILLWLVDAGDEEIRRRREVLALS